MSSAVTPLTTRSEGERREGLGAPPANVAPTMVRVAVLPAEQSALPWLVPGPVTV